MLETEETTVCGRTRAGQLWVTVAQLNEGGLGPRSSHNFEHAGEDEYSWESTLRTDTGGDQNKEAIQVAMFVHVGRRGFWSVVFFFCISARRVLFRQNKGNEGSASRQPLCSLSRSQGSTPRWTVAHRLALGERDPAVPGLPGDCTRSVLKHESPRCR